MNLDQIKRPVEKEMDDFEKKFHKSMQSNVSLLDTILNYIIKRKGKQMRPLFVFLSASIAGAIEEATYRGASLIELLHTATLVHDDVVDDAHYRRGFFSINALWKNKIAVLTGDYLLAKGLSLAMKNNDFEILKIVSTAVQEMSEGELLQIKMSKKLNITENIYYEVIQKKTASLIKACCKVGASSCNASPEIIQKFEDFGNYVGMAFQIKDDLFDYNYKEYEIGKPVGIDIKEKKLTLPLIYSLNNSSEAQQKKIKKLVADSDKKSQNVKEIINFVKSTGGIEYAEKVMNDFYNKALNILHQFPESIYRNSLEELVNYTILRKK